MRADIEQLFDDIEKLHVVVVGDVMLDNYWWGDVERISPEAPVPIVSLRKRESRLGGAANVALNCRTLGAKVTLASVIGDDVEGKTLEQLAKNEGIDTSLLQCCKRTTTTKTRVISRNQQMMRLDDEVTEDLATEDEHPFIDMVLRFLQIQKPQVLIFEDYNKGVLKENVINRITEHCRELGIITAVDPKKKNFLAYKNVTVFKPNLKEVREGLHIPLTTVDQEEMDHVHAVLQKQLHHSITFVTLSEKGVYYSNGDSAIIPSHLRNIADVSGAGDTVIATASIVYALTKDARLMAEISNIAGGLVCEEVGVVPIKRELLKEESLKLLTD
ncbi:bifunctional heptose 7-phosphate kinase/heptose 1-phosphate adenyltransferase [Polluticoccus soli]|uniref:bifunctional heptose 7-phosphate kinase/heptose 1-phosphate adenyltransferase n=1 Tax=Polluticoccus soli TaxID=3034150 RepID=UPI0023E0E85B|nr:bifunctional ADP-heptose synthase [Flavipsychrobacter sp. JY13-12]